MKKQREIGIILILAGIALPSILFPFARGYDPDDGLLVSLKEMEIRLMETEKKFVYVPYKIPFVLGIAFVLTGVGLVILSIPKIKSN